MAENEQVAGAEEEGAVAPRERNIDLDVLDMVETELRYQVVEVGFTPEHDDAVSREDWIAKITSYLGRAYGADDERYERSMVRVAAVAIAAVKAHRRVSADGRRVMGFDDGPAERVDEVV